MKTQRKNVRVLARPVADRRSRGILALAALTLAGAALAPTAQAAGDSF